MGNLVSLVHSSDHPDGPFFTVGEVAKRLGKDKDTIRRWVKSNDDLAPTHKMPLGEKDYYVWLYTERDVERLEEFSRNIRVGRPPKNQNEETG